jgi:hypothetical protein
MPGVGWHSVPHFNRGRPSQVNGIVIHQFAGGTVAAVQNWLRNPASRVSYHFGVGRNGEIRQWVDTGDTAWATGPVNGRTIAIGHEATNQPLTDAQMAATARIIRWARGAHRQIPAGRNGLSGHRQWMGTNCPGDPIMRQLDELQRRSTGAAPAPQPPPQPPPQQARRDQMTVQVDFGRGEALIGLPNGARAARLTSAGPGQIEWSYPLAPGGPGAPRSTHTFSQSPINAARVDASVPSNQFGLLRVRRVSAAADTVPVYLTWVF